MTMRSAGDGGPYRVKSVKSVVTAIDVVVGAPLCGDREIGKESRNDDAVRRGRRPLPGEERREGRGCP